MSTAPEAESHQESEPVKPPLLPSRKKTSPGWWKVFEFFASFGLATVVLFFLFIITWVGTLEQVENGLHVTVREYFESLYAVYWVNGVIPIPLPGGYLLLLLLFLNIVCGGIIRLRKKPQTIGILIAHLSIAFLIVAGAVSFYFKKDGNMALWPGDSSNLFQSFTNWVVEVKELGTDSDVWMIHDSDFKDLEGSKSRVFTNDALPFELKLFGYVRNSELGVADGGSSGGQPVVDGFYLKPSPAAKEDEMNVGGVLCEVLGKDGSKLGESVITFHPSGKVFTFEADGRKFAVEMNRERWEVPFTVRLDKFVHEVYPKTNKPRVFRSEITRTENGIDEPVKISMNEPMRYKGYTFFQASWGPQGAGPNDPKFSQFEVAKNPSDHWPLWSCIAAFIGLALHFSMSLWKFSKRSAKKSSAKSETAAGEETVPPAASQPEP
ncbi:MAG: cytochrome c biogenesis protein ResB [Verrucomicrobiae bacterium]|nr:cytochrome c biogenesis protein ResB [Verrucomicrobiae bacterium]